MAFKVVGLAGNLVLARLLVPKDFGLVALGLTLVGLGQFLANSGLGAALIARTESPSRPELRALTGLQLLITTAVGGLGAAIAGTPGQDGLVTAFMMLALPLMAFRTPAMLLLSRNLAFKKSVWVEVTETAVNLAWSVSAATLGYGAWALASAMVVKTLFGTIVACALSPA